MAATMIRGSRLLLPSGSISRLSVGAPAGRFVITTVSNPSVIAAMGMVTMGARTIVAATHRRRSFMTQAQAAWTRSSRQTSTTRTTKKHSRSFSSPGGAGKPAEGPSKTFWQRFLEPKPMPERNTAAWYREMILICTVFGITGSSTMIVSAASLCSSRPVASVQNDETDSFTLNIRYFCSWYALP